MESILSLLYIMLYHSLALTLTSISARLAKMRTMPSVCSFDQSRNWSSKRLPKRIKGPAENGNKISDNNGVMSGNRLNALLVDGNRFLRAMQKETLRNYGVDTEAVDNGQAALDLLASGSNFNLIFLDINLPVLNGLEAARQIRIMGVQTKMIGMTCDLCERDRQAFLDAGVDEVIEKPLTVETLMPILMELNGF